MTPITTGELTSARLAANSHLPELVTLKRATSVSDGHGGQAQSWTTVASNVPCRVMIMRSVGNRVELMAGKETEQATHKLTFAAETDVRAEDQVELGTRQFRVKFVEQRSLEVTRRALCVEL